VPAAGTAAMPYKVSVAIKVGPTLRAVSSQIEDQVGQCLADFVDVRSISSLSFSALEPARRRRWPTGTR
jgi:hypothetical protein